LELALPHVDWSAAFGQDPAEPAAPPAGAATGAAREPPGAAGCGRLSLAGGLEVVVVEDAAQLPAALAALRASMEDSLVAIDLVCTTRTQGVFVFDTACCKCSAGPCCGS